ncbi:DUF6221 family protein [Kitasatospora cineracea]|uniref:Uncharacterized protein n=1 Tax=Kitasatospora cineracea TaxID=88074 RepID=A0A3N4RV64_9ACTN|nr:DUF6221 family protein [Kitasatospora cineracea]RPE34931.1 hypothetical protein EDD38_3273 [Kitasatospora cineracea]
MTADLVAFLRARLAEDEQVARAVDDNSAPWDGQWAADGRDVLRTINGHVLARATATTDGRNLPIPLKPGLTEHWARHDPARVLAEVDAKRRIIAQYERAREGRRTHPDDLASAGAVLALYGAVKLLALPYAEHPDYREEWRP